MRRTGVLISIALAAALGAACSSSNKSSSTPPTSAATNGATTTSIETSQTGVTLPDAQPFTLEEGFEHDVCGIGISVKFIPPTATSASATEAVLQGGQISNVIDNVQDHTGDQPLPANAAKAVAGTTVTVYGKQFKVDDVDVKNSKVTLTPVC